LSDGTALLDVVEEISAGHLATRAVGPRQAIRIMTGAPIPDGADAVVAVERTNSPNDRRVQIVDKPQPGQNILRHGAEMRPGDIVLKPGTVLRPQEFGLLASVGRTAAKIHPPPRVAIIATGDELVEAFAQPGPGQIRNGNGPMLLAQVSRAGGLPRNLGIARDTPESLRSLIGEGLRFDILILSGGVSAGKLDLVPGILSELGVEPHFHKVEMKPGKPVFFGTKGQTLVFGLPGNPVSSLACFELFVRPAIRRLCGYSDPGPRMVEAELVEDYRYRTDRPTYHPAWLDDTEDGYRVRIVPWFGSPDLRALTQANALAVLPRGDHVHERGKELDVLVMDRA
jgi:molybdopterin molybdotransferase